MKQQGESLSIAETQRLTQQLQELDIESMAGFFHALSSPVRLKILCYMADGERCACEFPQVVAASQPNTSRNLVILKKAGLITFRREGQKLMYSLTNSKVLSWIMAISAILKGEDNDATN
jgi:DNA-binding transcriptional ArsR family regulator